MLLAVFVGIVIFGGFLFTKNKRENESKQPPAFITDTPLSIGTPSNVSLGRKLFFENKFEEAAKMFELAMKEGNIQGRDLALLGISYYRTKKAAEAEEILVKAEKKYPKEPLIYIGLGYVEFGKKDYQKCLAFFEKAKKISPGLKEAVNGIAATYINLGVEAYAKGNVGKSEEFFKKALSAKPNSAEALTNIGILKQDEGNSKEAVSFFKRADKYKPNDPKILKFLAESLKETDGLGSVELLETAEKLSKASPFDPYPYELMGRIYEKKSNTKKALEAFSTAYGKGSEDPYIYYRLAENSFNGGDNKKAVSLLFLAVGKSVHRIGQIQVGAAKRMDERKGKLEKEDIKALKKYSDLLDEPKKVLDLSISLLHKVRGSDKLFEADIEKLLSWYPHSVDIRVAFGKLLEDEKKWDRALNVWNEIAEKHPYNYTVHVSLANIIAKVGNYEKAVLECKKAIDIDSKKKEAYDLLIGIYLSNKDKESLFSFLTDRFELNKYNETLVKEMIKAYEMTDETEKASQMKGWLTHLEDFKKK